MKGLALGAVTTAWSTAVVPALNLPDRPRTVVNAAFGISLAAVTRAPLGSSKWRSGLKWGLGAAAVPALASVVIASVPALATRVRPSDDNLAEWVLFRIPIGTVVTEELVFRAVFDDVSPSLSPVFFGLWHIHPARAAGDSVIGTVAGTMLAGALFSWLHRRSGSVLAPMLLHYGVNASGAVLAAHNSTSQGRM
ncbi:CPBP family intramembrane glutamic endopeptidase [Rhodococcus sp. 14-2470-1a]|uniref:CPBP family intramembrane glutamic endopeptidase n=1 Tax=Rhodococcus sp. 14-2470-1a TaxID=2023150 RepID=UPI000B9BC176|nr:CPBP family intramembrane glutamic endopeptidase [Rhodococcus sp. 14-2470-1a]OZF55959.1 CPBP family intramembrane metalloprotease [Rhodococcus sp. 14-2470-1a]